MSYNEAPFSSTIKYKSEDDFNQMITVRGESGAEVLDRVDTILNHLRQKGAKPLFPEVDNLPTTLIVVSE